MANRFPLIANASTQRIEELASSDALDLTGSPIVNAPNIEVLGITTSNSYNVGATQVISSARQLQNIASLDATTTATIETAIANAPNDFTSLNVAGIGTISTLSVTNAVTSSAGVLGSNGNGTRYVSTGDPSGGSNGDIWYKTLT
jgi:hypothetical protein